MSFLLDSVNQIHNQDLKETFANCALEALTASGKLSKDNLSGLQVEFGYLLVIPKHGTEALFKIIHENQIFYFAVQKEKLLVLDLNEERYQSITEFMLKQHT